MLRQCFTVYIALVDLELEVIFLLLPPKCSGYKCVPCLAFSLIHWCKLQCTGIFVLCSIFFSFSFLFFWGVYVCVSKCRLVNAVAIMWRSENNIRNNFSPSTLLKWGLSWILQASWPVSYSRQFFYL